MIGRLPVLLLSGVCVASLAHAQEAQPLTPSQAEVTATTAAAASSVAVTPAVEEAAVYVQSCALNIDETTWKEQRKRRTLWTLVTTQLSVFTIATGRGAAVLQKLVGEWYSGTITSDRAKA